MGPQFDLGLMLLSVCSFAFSTHVCTGFFLGFLLSKTFQKHVLGELPMQSL